jgi:hypothetical protein
MFEPEDKGTTIFQNVDNYRTFKHHVTYQKDVFSQALLYNTTVRQEQKATRSITYSLQLENSTKKNTKGTSV